MAFTDEFSGQLIAPVDSTYEAITLDEDKALVWPVEAATGTDLLVQWIDVTPLAAGWTLTLPDATQGGTGFASILTNLGADDYTLEDADGNVVQVIGDGEAWLFWLKDNTDAAGVWGTLQIGSTTSEASASALAGRGLTVIGLTLNQSHPVWNLSGNYTIDDSIDRARLLKWTGGSGTVSVPSASVLGDNWFTLFSNQGSASVTVDPSGAQTIDGAATKSFAIGESAFIVSDGSNLFTVGYGRSSIFTETYASIDVSGNTNYVLSTSEFTSTGINLFGTLTGNIDVECPAAVHEFIVFNNTSGAFTITVKVNGQTGVSVEQGESSLLFNNGTDVVAGNTSSAIATVLFDNGTVTAPSITFTSDTNTGFFRFAADTIGVAAGGVLSARFNTVASGVNTLTFTPGATGNAAVLGSYSGTDADAGITITPQGAGVLTVSSPATITGALTASATANVVGNFSVATNKFNVTAASGNTAIAGTLGVTGDVAVNTNKFTVTASSGNTLVAGTLSVTSDVAVNTNKFTVAASSGNTVVAGTLGVTGAAIFTTTATASAFIPSGSSAPTNGMYLPAANTLGWGINSAAEMQLTSTALSPAVSDGSALGTSSLMWADLFLASGGVVNFNNGDVTITHSSNTLAFAGASSGYTFDALATVTGVVTGSSFVPTSSSAPTNGLYLSAANTPTIAVNSAGEVQFTGTATSPVTSDGNALGTTALMWADLFLASGGVVNFNNGNATLTHSAGVLTSNVPLTASSFIPTSSSAPTNGMYLPAANTLAFSTSSTRRFSVLSDGSLLSNGLTIAIDPASGTDDGWSFNATNNVLSQSNNETIVQDLRRRTSNGVLVRYWRDTTNVGSISVTTTATAYNTSSDERLKENIVGIDIQKSSEIIDAIRPVSFTWKSTKDPSVGFIAQEVYQVVPEAVTKGQSDDAYWQMDAAKLIPYMVAEIKFLRDRVKSLESAITFNHLVNG